MDYPSIHEPIMIGKKRVKNRIEVAPAAPFIAGHDGSLSSDFYHYNESLAKSGAGIVVTGVTSVAPSAAPIGQRVMNAGSNLFCSDFNELAECIHKYGALASVELVHTRYMLTPPKVTANETSVEDIQLMVKQFADAAERLVNWGFDMAMIHGGHGNVPAMFFNKNINQRSDEYGGSFEGRAKVAHDILAAIRERVGDKLALEYRISAEELADYGMGIDEMLELAKYLEPYVDLFHVSRGLLEEDDLMHYINVPMYMPRAMNLPAAERFKAELSKPVTVVGSFDLELAEKAISEGKVDMVSMIRTIYADNDCVMKARCGEADNIRPCIRCNTCIDRTHSYLLAVRCAVNPTLGREARYEKLVKADTSKKIAVIGGGPAGLQAAQTLSAQGHKVVLYEKEDHLGGKLHMAAIDPLKGDIKKYLEWSIRTVEADSNVTVKLGVMATPEMIQAEHFDAVMLACGSDPIIPDFKSSEQVKVIWVGDAEGQLDTLGERVVIAGAGMTGMEFALSVAKSGRKVTLVDPSPYDKLGQGGTLINIRALKELLNKEDVEFVNETYVDAVDGSVVKAHKTTGENIQIEADTLVLSLGFRVNNAALEAFEKKFGRIYRIGDCRGFAAANLFNATQSAHDAARLI